MSTVSEAVSRTAEVYFRHLTGGTSYAGARRHAESELGMLGVARGSHPAMPLPPDLYRGGPVHERPNLALYARMLTARWLAGALPATVDARLCRSANYFGDSELAAEVALTPRDHELESAVYLRLLQQQAKAYKDQGRFDLSHSVYGEALRYTCSVGLDADTAHFLMLYAKLCHDYQQRQGWYLAFHKIAKERFEALAGPGTAAPRFPTRWYFIARESYAQALYAHHPSEAERLYAELLGECDSESEGYLRARAHQLRWRLNRILEYSFSVPAADEVLREFRILPQIALRLRNRRAWNVRQVQYLGLVRQVVGRSGAAVPGTLTGLCEGEALDLARDAEAGAGLFTDRKTLALARVERALWEVLLHSTGPGLQERALGVAIGYLLQARDACTGAHEPLTSIYLDVLGHLAESHVTLRDWSEAIQRYDEAYEYGLFLKQALERDEEQIARLLKGDGVGAEDAVPPEFGVLDPAELRALREELRIDYKELLNRLLGTAGRLHRLRQEQTRALMRTSRELSIDFRYHGVFQRLRELSGALSDAAPEALPRIEQLKRELESWRHVDSTVFSTQRIDAAQAIADSLREAVVFEPHRGHVRVVGAGEPLYIQFDEVILRSILENLVFNVYEAANRSGRADYLIVLKVYESRGLVWLACEDDVGDFDAFAQVVREVNEGIPVRSRRGVDGGKGLSLVRRFIVHLSGAQEPWLLRSLEGGHKELAIALAHRVDDD